MVERRRISLEGVVQGVGFRPYVHSLATANALTGFVRNDGGGVVIEVEGDTPTIEHFLAKLTTSPPPLATIRDVNVQTQTLVGERSFAIVASDARREATALSAAVAADVALCDACALELYDPSNRRYRYPFISCTQCGPRFTILDEVPYDRERTSMRAFHMCSRCADEYHDPRDRRFHAQTNACWDCGPQLSWYRLSDDSARHGDAILSAVDTIRSGEIVAIKGLGGFHLACDASNDVAVARLRARKHRDAKPLAVMVADLESVAKLAVVNAEEAVLLRSAEHPIVLLEKAGRKSKVAEAAAPGNARIGVMLPYTPLHRLLLTDVGRPLIMTSGNVSGEPMPYDDTKAFEQLREIADAFLIHDRRIANRCDDTVVRARSESRRASSMTIIRRARGYAPRAVHLREEIGAPVLGVGGHLKNTFCLAAGHSAILSQHIGDLDAADARIELAETIDSYSRMFDVRPRIIAHDVHPDYGSTCIANSVDGETRVAVQHHHAHVASCLAEHGVAEPALGAAFDGSGLGNDGAVWGGELLFVDGPRCTRLGNLGYVPLPGGDAAVLRPWRAAAAHVWNAFGDLDAGPSTWRARRTQQECAVVRQMLTKRVHSPPTSSMGRLFDAVASLVGVCDDARFEGQAAIALENIADEKDGAQYPIETSVANDRIIVDPAPVIRGVVADVVDGVSRSRIAGRFHNTVAAMIVALARDARRRTGVRRIVLTGGVFQNALLERLATTALVGHSFDVLLHVEVPCNDGGLSLGQALVAWRSIAGA
jgi:hydrogenase maturation protein HypF